MDAELPGIKKNIKRVKKQKSDRHGWNALENYQQIYQERVANHPFVDTSKPIPELEYINVDDALFLILEGRIHCKNSVILSITKWFETRETKQGRLLIRCFAYSYNARIFNGHNILRYDNGHDLNEYHKHIFDIETGNEIDKVSLTREEFPLLHEVLDELESIINK